MSLNDFVCVHHTDAQRERMYGTECYVCLQQKANMAEEELERISKDLCGVSVVDEGNYADVYHFVEGAINQQSDLKEKAEKIAGEALLQLNAEMEAKSAITRRLEEFGRHTPGQSFQDAIENLIGEIHELLAQRKEMAEQLVELKQTRMSMLEAEKHKLEDLIEQLEQLKQQ